MFSILGIGALIVFVLARPQELAPFLQHIPFLYIFAGLAIVGYVVDLRLRRVQPIATPTLPWVIALLLWAIVCTAAMTKALLVPRIIELAILFILYFTISHGVQTFRAFQTIVGVLVCTCLFIAAICFHQGMSPQQCIVSDDTGEGNGSPDGRECETVDICRTASNAYGAEYRCDQVGLFGISSIEGRVRYTGELHDPNEVSLTICAGGLAMLFGFVIRRRSGTGRLLTIVAIGLVVWTVIMTGSRGGLVMMMMVPGVYAVRRWKFKAVIPALLIVLPVMSLGGRSGEDADLSTQLRYEAWSTGLTLFHQYPIFGVGPRQFGEYHSLTAHNSYVLTLTEMGFVGMVLFVSLLVLSIKALVVGMSQLKGIAGAAAARDWGMSLLAAMCGIAFQIGTLSFAYHSVLWIFFGLVGAWCSAMRHHLPTFRVRLTLRDMVLIIMGCLLYAFVVLPIFLHAKGEM